MSADIATYQMTVPSTPPPTPADFTNDEPKIYISTAKLELKLSAMQNSNNITKDYVWHTHVVQPSAAEEEVVKKSAASKPAEAVNRNLYTPAQRHGEKAGSLAATLFNFLDVERYHSERNQLASEETKTNETESTYI